MNRMFKQTTLAAAMIATVGAAQADQSDYMNDSRDNVVRNSYGECWHTGTWSKGDAIVGCDGKVAEVAVAEVVVEEPAPAPTYRVEKVERVTLDAETYFAFDKATLKPGGVDKLDALIEKIKQSKGVERITVTGHADPLGPASYNQKLSERRAMAVRDYLVERVDNSDRITSQGKGESMPVIKCPDMKGNALIACLAPNRRVDIDAELRMPVVAPASGM